MSDQNQVEVGSIHVTYELAPDGDMLTSVEVLGDMPLVVSLGLLDMARDTLLSGLGDGEDPDA